MRRYVLSLLAAVLLAAAPAAAQAPAAVKAQQTAQGESQKQAVAKRQAREKALADSGLTEAQLDDLIQTLETPAEREKLVSRLKGLKAGTAGDGAKKPPPSRFGGRIVERISERINAASEEVVKGAAMVLDAPRLLGWFEEQLTDPKSRELWVRVLWKVLAVLAAGLLAEWVVRWLLHRPRAAVEGQARDSLLLRLPFLLARTVLDIVPIFAFAGAAYVVLPLLDPSEVTRLTAISLVNANVVARAIMAAARMFLVPKATNLRIVRIGDESANYLVLWIRRFTNVGVYGYFLAEAALLLGMPESGYLALIRLIGLLIALLLVIFILQNRTTVARWIRGPEDAYSGLRMLRRRFGDIWHVLAVIYVFAVYVVWVLGIEGGFEFVFRATALSLIIIVAAKLLMIGSRKAVDHGFGLRADVMAQYPGLAARANRYFAVLHIAINVAIAVAAVFAVLEAWGIDSFGWMGTPLGRRVVGSVVTSALVIVIAVIFLEMVSSMIERYLARDGDVELSARAKTLLPLLRKAVLVVVSTVVILIVLSEIGVNIGPLLAGAGVVGLAIGFGSQTLVKDVITGVFILAENQFAVGDIVRVSDKAGLVEDITIRTIRLRDLAGNVHMIPFSAVTTVENMTKDFSRYVFDVGVAYRENVDEVIQVLRDLGAEMQADEYYGTLIKEPLEIMGLDSFGDSAVVVRARFTTLPIKQWEVGREFNRRIKQRFDELGIEIPFPHQTVYFGEAKDGSAPPARVEIGGGRVDGDGGNGDGGNGDGGNGDGNAGGGSGATPARTDPVDNVSEDGK